MLFNSIEFLLFSLVVFPTYFLLPIKLRWVLLLAASIFFYGFWKVEYLGLIFVSAVTDFFCAQKMVQTNEKKARRPYLWLSLFVNLGLLGVFKYFNFFLDTVDNVFGSSGGFNSLNLLLPMVYHFIHFKHLPIP